MCRDFNTIDVARRIRDQSDCFRFAEAQAWVSASYDERTFGIIRLVCAVMFRSSAPVVSEEVESQAVGYRIELPQQRIAKLYPLHRVDPTFEYGFLHSLSVILTHLCDPT